MPDTRLDIAPPEFRLDEQVGHLLHHAYHKASAHFARRLKPYKLKPRQFWRTPISFPIMRSVKGTIFCS